MFRQSVQKCRRFSMQKLYTLNPISKYNIQILEASPRAFYCTKMCEKSKSTTFSYILWNIQILKGRLILFLCFECVCNFIGTRNKVEQVEVKSNSKIRKSNFNTFLMKSQQINSFSNFESFVKWEERNEIQFLNWIPNWGKALIMQTG